MTLYVGDSRNNPSNNNYSLSDYMDIAGHEFGHTLGIADVYSDNKITNKFPSIMNNPYGLGGVQPVDYDMMFIAQRNGTWTKYSSNIDVLKQHGITI